jgi:DNA modification methylase
MSSSELDTLQQAFRDAGGKWSTFIIWAKNTFTLGRSDY